MRGRRLKGKGEGVLGVKLPFPSLSNACHAGYGILGFYTAGQLKNLADNVKEKNF